MNFEGRSYRRLEVATFVKLARRLEKVFGGSSIITITEIKNRGWDSGSVQYKIEYEVPENVLNLTEYAQQKEKEFSDDK